MHNTIEVKIQVSLTVSMEFLNCLIHNLKAIHYGHEKKLNNEQQRIYAI